jgi:ribosomal protein S18 acetylase RimI-like enzyme
MSDEVLIRNLEVKDLPGVAAVHMAAFHNSALTMLGTEAVRRYYEWQLLGPHESVSLGAFLGTEVVGFCVGGIFRGALAGYLRKNRIFLAWRVLTHPWLMTNPIFRERLTFVTHIGKPSAKPTASMSPAKSQVVKSYGILSIGVHPECRGLGVGKLLMKESEEIARQRGFSEMDLTVHADNHQAIKFYESLSWEKISNNGVWSGGMKKSIKF